MTGFWTFVVVAAGVGGALVAFVVALSRSANALAGVLFLVAVVPAVWLGAEAWYADEVETAIETGPERLLAHCTDWCRHQDTQVDCPRWCDCMVERWQKVASAEDLEATFRGTLRRTPEIDARMDRLSRGCVNRIYTR